jgi:hypothetical protein
MLNSRSRGMTSAKRGLVVFASEAELPFIVTYSYALKTGCTNCGGAIANKSLAPIA